MQQPQSFKRVVKLVKKSKRPWEDDQFPAADSSLVYSGAAPTGIKWLRMKEIHPEAALFTPGKPEKDGKPGKDVEPGDIVQGELGDCWFLGALSVLAVRESMLHQLIPKHSSQTKTVGELGVLQFRFYKDGAWRDVLIDDRLPCRDGKPIYAHGVDPKEMWVAFAEKAYAKMHGSYQALEGGSTADALIDMTGGICEQLDLEAAETLKAIEDGSLWRSLLQSAKQNVLIGASHLIDSERAAHESELGSTGLLVGHAYGVLDVREEGKHKLLKLRNPWGIKEWTGEWSDGKMPEKWKKKLKHEAGNDGCFWMAFEDFAKNYNNVVVLRLLNTSWKKAPLQHRHHLYELFGEWKGASAGGCQNNKDTWLRNPQFTFALDSDQVVILQLMQNDPRTNRHAGAEKLSIGFTVVKTDVNRTQAGLTAVSPDEIVAKAAFINRRQLYERVELKKGRYVVVPSTFDAGVEGKFLLRVLTWNKSALTQLATADTVKIPSARIEVVSAEGVRACDIEGTSDPYCKLRPESNLKNKLKTSTKLATLSPEWHESFLFTHPGCLTDTIHIEMYDHDALGADDFMGAVRVPLSDFKDKGNGSWELAMKLKNNDKHPAVKAGLATGELKLRVTVSGL